VLDLVDSLRIIQKNIQGVDSITKNLVSPSEIIKMCEGQQLIAE